jgi:hypothetical protein
VITVEITKAQAMAVNVVWKPSRNLDDQDWKAVNDHEADLRRREALRRLARYKRLQTELLTPAPRRHLPAAPPGLGALRGTTRVRSWYMLQYSWVQ